MHQHLNQGELQRGHAERKYALRQIGQQSRMSATDERRPLSTWGKVPLRKCKNNAGSSLIVMEGFRGGKGEVGQNNCCGHESSIMVTVNGMTVTEQRVSKLQDVLGLNSGLWIKDVLR